ncbi:hypothetical protein DFJ77DRAFT_473372 [Powellomyces hirtus]|nr:hypothetical protein DFJ77DRAFT_473372 [Powellomyces hirtus]
MAPRKRTGNSTARFATGASAFWAALRTVARNLLLDIGSCGLRLPTATASSSSGTAHSSQFAFVARSGTSLFIRDYDSLLLARFIEGNFEIIFIRGLTPFHQVAKRIYNSTANDEQCNTGDCTSRIKPSKIAKWQAIRQHSVPGRKGLGRCKWS